jgi:hypothetical protein
VVDASAPRLRKLASEIRAEIERIARTVEEIDAARAELEAETPARLAVYGSAALLETYYSGVEKALMRIAAVSGGVPEGPAWHRALLEDMLLDVPGVRPAVLSEEAARLLEPYLSFRHRFRNLYLFDLRAEIIAGLLADARRAWGMADRDLSRFAATLDELAGRLEESS